MDLFRAFHTHRQGMSTLQECERALSKEPQGEVFSPENALSTFPEPARIQLGSSPLLSSIISSYPVYPYVIYDDPISARRRSSDSSSIIHKNSYLRSVIFSAPIRYLAPVDRLSHSLSIWSLLTIRIRGYKLPIRLLRNTGTVQYLTVMILREILRRRLVRACKMHPLR